MMMVDEGREDDPRQRSVNEASTDATRLHIRTWRAKAEELRKIAAGLKNEHTRQLLLNAAANYDRLADQAEERDRAEASRRQPETC
jgi:hypothetical protein